MEAKAIIQGWLGPGLSLEVRKVANAVFIWKTQMRNRKCDTGKGERIIKVLGKSNQKHEAAIYQNIQNCAGIFLGIKDRC